MISWREEYSIGVDEIDNQHKKLFKIADSTYALLKNELYLDKYDRILALLQELKEYTIFHFKTEEEYMKTIGYKKYLSHKVLHDDFIEKINNMDLDKIDQNQDKYITEILDFVLSWISGHILGSDKKITANEL